MSNKAFDNKLSVRNPILKAFNYFLLIFAVLLITVPIYIVFVMSFKSNQEYMHSGIFEFPLSFLNFENYFNVIVKGKLILGFKNTMTLAVISVTGSILMGSMVAFVLGRFNFKFRNLIISLFLLSTIIPSVTTQVATFTVIKNLHLYNTIFAGIALYLATDVLQVYILLQFIEKIPVELDESAMIDGATYFQIYRLIILPLLKPAIVTVIILKTIVIYNDMFTPYLYMPKSSLRTVTMSILQFSSDQNSQWNIMGAGIIAVMLPTLILYLFLQKYIMAGVTEGAVKG